MSGHREFGSDAAAWAVCVYVYIYTYMCYASAKLASSSSKFLSVVCVDIYIYVYIHLILHICLRHAELLSLFMPGARSLVELLIQDNLCQALAVW